MVITNMRIGAPVIGNEIHMGEGNNTFLRLRNGALWIELDYDPEEDYTYVYEVSDTEELEEMYRACLTERVE